MFTFCGVARGTSGVIGIKAVTLSMAWEHQQFLCEWPICSSVIVMSGMLEKTLKDIRLLDRWKVGGAWVGETGQGPAEHMSSPVVGETLAWSS